MSAAAGQNGSAGAGRGRGGAGGAEAAAWPAGQSPWGPTPSVLVLTKNEEVNIAACLETLAFSDDIVVLDSYSTDRTVEIASRFPNVRVIQRKFDTWSRHSNWALDNIKFKHPWVYYSDADERVTPALRDEMCRRVNDAGEGHVAYRLKYKNMFMGRWLKRGGVYPVWIIRLYQPDKIRYEDRAVNAHPLVHGSLGDLKEDFIHYSFNKGLMPWFIKHNSYSDMEAGEAVRVTGGSMWSKFKGMFSREPGVARRSLKDLSFFIPMRAMARFMYMYFGRLGVLDGKAGFHYAAMISMYEYWIEIKLGERRKDWRARTEAKVKRMLGSMPGGEEAQESAVATAAGAAPRYPTAPDGSPLIEVLIPTYNEAAHIAETVANASVVGPVFVLDSFSTDGTQEIARRAGATVVEHKFENYSRQKNWGLDNLPMRGKWVFILDADERITPELRDELFRVARDGQAATGYYVNRVVIMMGRAIRHGGMLPSWNLRFFQRGKARYEDRSVHEHMVCDGPTAYLRHLMLHIRRETISEYLAKHIKYAQMESDEWIKGRRGEGGSAKAGSLFGHLLRYRLYLRRDIWPYVPYKPFVRFSYMYFLRLGFLDRGAGWHLAQLMASYEYMIKLLYEEKLEALRESWGAQKDEPQRNGSAMPALPAGATGAEAVPSAGSA